MGIDRGKTIRTWRLALTCIFLFLISWYYKIPESSWSLVTIWFVMYEYTTVGGVLNKSMLRFLGTVISASYGVIIIYFCGNDPIINMLALVAGLFFYTYWFMGNDKTYTGTIGAVTLTIVLLNYNDIEVAILRAFNVLIGIIASVFMIRFFYPQYARNLLIEAQLGWCNQLIELIGGYLDLEQEQQSLKNKSYTFEHSFLANLATYNRLVGEAKMETKSLPSFTTHCIAIKEEVQLLFRLFNLFFATLATAEGRNHPWVIAQFEAMRHKVQAMKNQLLHVAPPLNQSIALFAEEDEKEAPVALVLNNREAIEALIEEMNALLDALGKEITHNVLIYEHYECILDDRLRI
ncbi:FUSC family protein [Legionella sp. km772]|uniref:FUSC family protein n=1 Tax=Legionella sp. km772 TaxID=2498111 RepID=UPI000F8EDB16|nr:FUSC family protein [Legionella sp. km772]RUR10161.1 FUSC family protein [Legionella sp. km772]